VQVFGAGGPKMKAAGMELLLDLTEHAVVGLVEVLKNYGKFRRIFWDLVRGGRPAQAGRGRVGGFSRIQSAVRRADEEAPHQGDLLHLAAVVGVARQPRQTDRARRRFDADDFPVREGLVRRARAEIAGRVRGTPVC
jgi:hypothetical protein